MVLVLRVVGSARIFRLKCLGTIVCVCVVCVCVCVCVCLGSTLRT